MVAVTTTGLRADGSPVTEYPDVPWAIAAGTVNAITAAYDEPNTSLADGLILSFRASGANTTTTPTFSPDGLTARTIVKTGGVALAAGDIPGALTECLVRYNLANTRWELLNPYTTTATSRTWVAGGGAVDAITATYSPAVTALTDGLGLNVRAAGANTSTTPTFAPNGLTARTITREGGKALQVGDIPAADAELQLRYNLAGTRWELLNPAKPIELYKILSADDTGGTNVSTAQPWLPTTGSVAVLADTLYEFEGRLYLSRSAGTTSHTTGILFGGTATLTSIDLLAQAMTGDANANVAMNGVWLTAATIIVVKAASTSATEQVVIQVRGHVRINAAGTFIPQFQYSVAPGGAPTVKRGSFFRLRPLGLGSATEQGTWA
jgi:hypothetical protein